MNNLNLNNRSIIGGVALFLLSPIALATTKTTTFSNINQLGLAESMTESSGQQRLTTYNQYGQILSKTRCGTACGDSNDKVTSYTYESGQLKTISHPDGRITTVNYDANRNISSVVVEKSLDSMTETRQVNKFGWLDSITDVNGMETTINSRDEYGRITSVTEMSNSPAEAVTKTFEYYPGGQLKKMIVNPGGSPGKTNTTEYKIAFAGVSGGYQTVEKKTTWQSPDGLQTFTDKTTFEYDNLGRQISETIHSQNPEDLSVVTFVTTISYEENYTESGLSGCELGGCRKMTVTPPHGGAYEIVTNLFGSQVRVTSPRGESMEAVYDDFGKLIARKSAASSVTGQPDALSGFDTALNLTTTYSYDSSDKLTSVLSGKDSNNDGTLDLATEVQQKASFSYNDLGLRESVLIGDSSNGIRTVYEYDENHRPINTWKLTGGTGTSTSGFTNRVSNVYDSLGRMIQTTVADGTSDALTTTYTYSNMRLTSVDGPRTDVVDDIEYSYSTGGKLLKTTDGLGKETIYVYNDIGQITSMLRPGQSAINYEYDGLGRKIKETIGTSGKSESYIYWSDGRLLKAQDLAGKESRFYYDAGGNLSLIDKFPFGGTPDLEDISVTYNVNGQLASLTDYRLGARTTSFYRDSAMRIVKADYQQIGTVNYIFDGMNLVNVQSKFDSESSVTNRLMSYDIEGRALTNTLDIDGQTLSSIQNTFSSRGLETVDYGLTNNVVSTFNYKQNALLASIKHENTSTNWDHQSHYSYKGSFIDGIVENGSIVLNPNRSFAMDENNRITSSNFNGIPVIFDYEDNGSIKEITQNPGGFGEDSFFFNSDVDGWSETGTLVKGAPFFTSNNFDLTRDNAGNLTSYPDENGAQVTATYDQSNRLTATDNGVTKSEFYYDGFGELIRECTGPSSGALVCTDILYALDSGLSRIIATKEGSNASNNYLYGARGELLSKSDGTTTRHYVSDHQNSIIGEIDDSGAWVGSRVYSPYGVTMTDTISDLPFGFNGEYTSDHNIQYLRNRSYLTNLAMFAQIDGFKGDMGSPNSQQRFSYGEGNPINNSDPTGNQVERAPIPPFEGFRPITREDLQRVGGNFPNLQVPFFQDNREELGPLLRSGRRERASIAGHGFMFPTPDIAECDTARINSEFQSNSFNRMNPNKFAEFLNAFTCGSKLWGDPDEYFTVPEDTTIVFGVPPMGELSDGELGPVFDRCEDNILDYRTMVYHANRPAPNLLIRPPVGLTVNRDGPWPVYTTDVEDGVRLSDLIEQHNLAGKIVCVSTCEEATGSDGSGFIYPQMFGAFNTRLDNQLGAPIALCENEECERSFQRVACRYGYCELDSEGNIDRGERNYPEFGN